MGVKQVNGEPKRNFCPGKIKDHNDKYKRDDVSNHRNPFNLTSYF